MPLDGDTLAEAAESYFIQSEQIPTLVRLALSRDAEGRHVAGGLFLQHLPEGELGRERLHTRLDHPEWEHVAILGRTVDPAELTDPALPLETLVWRRFNEEREVRVLAATAMSRGCRCSTGYFASVLARFPPDERAEMADEHGMSGVDCQFCATKFHVAAAEPVG